MMVSAFHTADFGPGCRPSRANISNRKSVSDISLSASSHVSPIGMTLIPALLATSAVPLRSRSFICRNVSCG